MSRGVLYVVWGGAEKEQENSAESLRKWHPELPIHVHHLPPETELRDKACLMSVSPFEETLYLDTDTQVLGRLDYGFAQARAHGLALCINECPWAVRFGGLKSHPNLQEYNTGVMFFTRRYKELPELWKKCSAEGDSSIMHMNEEQRLLKMPNNDRMGFALALYSLQINPFVLSMNWNYRPQWQRSFFGPIKVWHARAPVAQSFLDWNTSQDLENPGTVIQYAFTLPIAPPPPPPGPELPPIDWKSIPSLSARPRKFEGRSPQANE